MAGERGLDVEVAQMVFGVKRFYDEDGSLWGGSWNDSWPYYIPSGKSWRTHRIDAIPVPGFSTDILAAWLVVTEMRRQDRYHGFCWSVHQEIGYDEHVPEDLGWLLFERDASEVARLICRGALRAIAESSVLDLGGAARKNAELAAVREAADGEAGA